MIKIAGLQKMTLLDYPGKVACTVFLQGCNLRCPFCHNSQLLGSTGQQLIDTQDFFDFLKKRTGLLDGVCVSGGEPTVQPGLSDFLREIKSLGYPVKLDTNGTNPDKIKELVDSKLVDYVAMDIKNSPLRYAETTGVPHVQLDNVAESVRYLTGGTVAHEFRTTVVEEFHDAQAMEQMGRWLLEISGGNHIKKLFLQPFTDRDSVAFSGLHAPDSRKMGHYVELLRLFIDEVQLRG